MATVEQCELSYPNPSSLLPAPPVLHPTYLSFSLPLLLFSLPAPPHHSSESSTHSPSSSSVSFLLTIILPFPHQPFSSPCLLSLPHIISFYLLIFSLHPFSPPSRHSIIIRSEYGRPQCDARTHPRSSGRGSGQRHGVAGQWLKPSFWIN